LSPESTLPELLGRYNVCGLTYLQDVSEKPHVIHLQQISEQHRLIVSLGSRVDVVQEVLNNGALKVALSGESVGSDFLAQFPKERLVLEFTMHKSEPQGLLILP
jgi:hypothetical protein